MEDQGQRPVPAEEIDLDCLAGLNQARHAGHGQHRGHAGEGGEDALGAGGAEPRDQNLQRGAQQKRDRVQSE